MLIGHSYCLGGGGQYKVKIMTDLQSRWEYHFALCVLQTDCEESTFTLFI